MIYFASIGLVLALLGIVVPQALALLNASRTGVIISRGYSGGRISREEDPGRFERFWQARAQRLWVPGLVLIIAAAWAIVQTIGLVTALRHGPEPYSPVELQMQRDNAQGSTRTGVPGS
jgi:hypothetical protein